MKKTRFPAALLAGLAAAGFLFSGGVALAQPALSALYPDGIYQFQNANALSFTVTSAAGVDPAGISVQLTSTTLTGQVLIKTWTSSNGLVVGGDANTRTVSVPLTSNLLYSAAIALTDVNNATTNTTVSFDTINGYTFEAEDFDYTDTNSLVSGKFFDNPQTNAYAGLSASSPDVSHNGSGNHDYRPNPPGLATETCGDKPRAPYVGTGFTDYDVGWNNGGDYAGYTRTFPAGVYNVYLRGADGNGAEADAASMTVVNGTAVFSGSGKLQFAVPAGGWQNYSWCPLKDANGDLVTLTTDGSVSTLMVFTDNGNYNANCYLLLPVNTNVVSTTVTVGNITPNGASLFQQSNVLSFTLTSPDPINTNGVSVQLTATNLWGQNLSATYTASSGLSFSGDALNWTVSVPLTSNTVYAAQILANDANGIPAVTNVSFDTIIPTYTFEAEDFNYGGGSFFDNPQTNAYNGYDALVDVDYQATQHGGAYNRVGLTTESLNEKQRPQYDGTGMQDYDVGFNDGGNWANYTRTYPAGTFNIYVRASNGNGNSGNPSSGSIAIVTGDIHAAGQTTVGVGSFTVPPTSGWGNYKWIPVRDSAGNLAQFTSDGTTPSTLRVTVTGGNYNANFYLLTPVDPGAKLLPYVDSFTPDGTAMFGSAAAQLSFLVHSQPGTDTGNISLTLNGTAVSGLNFSGLPTTRTVTYPLQSNMYYTAVVTVTDANGVAHATNTFNTFSTSSYQVEAEDYDYGSGSYHEGTVDAYAGVGGVSGVDFYVADPNAFGRGYSYRLDTALCFPDSTAGDQARDQFTSGGTDYSVGSFGPGSWMNFTRNYPAGTYYVIGRFAEGAGTTHATLAQVTNGRGTTNQVLNPLGTFTIPAVGWSSWGWQPLLNDSGKQVKVTLDGSLSTLQLGGSVTGSDPEVNVNFLMLVATTPDAPAVMASAALSGGNVVISFPTQNGSSYKVQYKAHLSDATWTDLPGVISGNGAVQSATDPATNGSRFYRVQIQ
ncbi:MAG TPA: hypothetical protein VL527_16940 [Dongiaceae bacterium]|nr:hypothetical protein [Dongiaceae bacterium]